MPNSRFNNQVIIDENNWAITIATTTEGNRVGGHAVIFYEGFENSNYFIKKLHLKVSSKESTPIVEERDLTKKDNITYEKKTKTIQVPPHSISSMLWKNRSGTRYDPGLFHATALLGWNSFINLPGRFLGFQPHNCFTWVIERMRAAGIKFSDFRTRFVVDDPKNFINHETNLVLEDDIFDLCRFAKEGNIEAIRRFPKDFNINQLVDFKQPEGPVEVFLGQYTPLALAIAYNHIVVVQIFVEEFHADLLLRSGRLRDFTALDCARTNWWGIRMGYSFFSGTPSRDIATYLESRGAITYKALKQKMKEEENTELFKLTDIPRSQVRRI